MGSWKLHIQQREEVNYGKKVPLKQPELYNVETDISEKYECATNFPEEVKMLLELCEKHKKDTEDALPDNLEARIEK